MCPLCIKADIVDILSWQAVSHYTLFLFKKEDAYCCFYKPNSSIDLVHLNPHDCMHHGEVHVDFMLSVFGCLFFCLFISKSYKWWIELLKGDWYFSTVYLCTPVDLPTGMHVQVFVCLHVMLSLKYSSLIYFSWEKVNAHSYFFSPFVCLFFTCLMLCWLNLI